LRAAAPRAAARQHGAEKAEPPGCTAPRRRVPAMAVTTADYERIVSLVKVLAAGARAPPPARAQVFRRLAVPRASSRRVAGAPDAQFAN
jgi:hypothetical protein